MNYFCTLFDSGYSSRGLALIESLNLVTTNFKIFVLAFDQNIYDILIKLNLQNVVAISLKDFEDQELLKVKSTRSRGEYCWTCTPSIIKYCLEKFNLPNCTYLDADLYFFSDPAPLFQEMGSSSVLITEHRYTQKYDQTEKSGKYCVQFMTFKNNEEGRRVLNWWRERCVEWCYSKVEDGKFGDQKYLDDWTTRFTGVHVLRHLGGGVAPWNLQQYHFQDVCKQIVLTEKISEQKYPLVFFHFHALKIYKDYFDLGLYELTKDSKELIYEPYLEELIKIDHELREKGLNFNWHAISPQKSTVRSKLRSIKRRLLRVYNVVPAKKNLNRFKNDL